MSEREGGGKPDAPGEPTEQQKAALTQLVEDIGFLLQGLLGSFAPEFPAEEFPRLLQLLVREQMEIAATIVPSLTDEDARKQAPRFGIRIYGPLKPGDVPDASKALMLIVDKRISTESANKALETTSILALLLMPAVRGMLRVKGFHYDFVQVKGEATEPSRIIM